MERHRVMDCWKIFLLHWHSTENFFQENNESKDEVELVCSCIRFTLESPCKDVVSAVSKSNSVSGFQFILVPSLEHHGSTTTKLLCLGLSKWHLSPPAFTFPLHCLHHVTSNLFHPLNVKFVATGKKSATALPEDLALSERSTSILYQYTTGNVQFYCLKNYKK